MNEDWSALLPFRAFDLLKNGKPKRKTVGAAAYMPNMIFSRTFFT